MAKQFPVLLTLDQIDRIVNLLKGQSQEISAAIDALNAPNLRSDAALYRKLTRLQDELVEEALE